MCNTYKGYCDVCLAQSCHYIVNKVLFLLNSTNISSSIFNEFLKFLSLKNSSENRPSLDTSNQNSRFRKAMSVIMMNIFQEIILKEISTFEITLRLVLFSNLVLLFDILLVNVVFRISGMDENTNPMRDGAVKIPVKTPGEF